MLKRIRIQNFKSLADVTVELDPLTVLIGQSGTGKSNFVDALRFLRDYLAKHGSIFSDQKGWEGMLHRFGGGPSTMTFDVNFDVKYAKGSYEYLLSLGEIGGKAGSVVGEERLAFEGKVLFHSKDRKLLVQPGAVSVGALDKPILGKLSGVLEITVAYLYLTRAIGCYDFPSNVLRAGPSSDSQTTELMDSGENYREAFAAIVNNLEVIHNWKEIIAALRCLNHTITSVEPCPSDQSSIWVGHSVKGKVLTLGLNQESEGLRRFLINLVALYQYPPKQTLVFEEPERGIHPGALSALADQIKGCADSGRAQVIMTTHSPQLLDLFDPAAIRVVELRDCATQIGPVSPEQMAALKEMLLRPGELLTVDQARVAPLATAG